MPKNSRRNRVGITQLTSEEITSMANLGVDAVLTVDTIIAERSGADDKVEAVRAENAPPRVKTFTLEGRVWIEDDPYGLKTEGLYGKKGKTALQPENLQAHAQVVGPLDPAKLTILHGPDETAPADGVTCPICNKLVTSFVQTALIDRVTNDLVRDDGVIRYRGQFVAVGPDPMNLPVHGAHPGECMFRLRLKRDRNGDVIYKTMTGGHGQTYEVPDLLPCHNFAQANARAAAVRLGLQTRRDQRVADENRMRQNLGFKVGDAARTSGGGNRTDDGIDRRSHAPRLGRGQTSKKTQPRRVWVENDTE